MFTVLNVVQPENMEEAYNVLMEKRNNSILGGCAFLRLGSQRIGTAVDLSRLNLDTIKEQEDVLEIGAATTFREIETNPLINQYFNRVLPEAVRNIIGVQFRNTVMVGASVYSRYGFSDLLTALLSLDVEVELYNGGRLSLEAFLAKPYEKDFLMKIYIKKNNRKAAYQNIRSSVSDYPVLNVAVSKLNHQWKIVVGARPQRAAIAVKASEELSRVELNSRNIEDIATLASQEIIFGTNTRGTAAYREAMCKVLVKRAILEVLECE
jgi:CO/xanthine dehydrogenase FAD-binding subunit